MTTVANNKEVSRFPKLRFKEFEGEWEKCKLGKVTEYTKGFAFKSESYKDRGVRIVRVSDLGEDRIKYGNECVYINEHDSEIYARYSIKKGNIIVTTVGSKPDMIESAVGRAIYVTHENEGFLNQNLLKFENLPHVTNSFINGFLRSKKYLHFIKGVARGNANQSNITVKDLLEFPVSIPTLPEQQKIASFLTAVDEKIQQLTRKKTLLEQYKKGVMQRLFLSALGSEGLKDDGMKRKSESQNPTILKSKKSQFRQLRFKTDEGNDYPDWEEKKLGEVFERVKSKNKENNLNVLTISAQQGLINQQKYFNKSVSGQDVTGYYLLEKGDFAYNKSYSKGYPMGAIKRLNNYDKGVVSTLYICFRMTENNCPDFYEEFLDHGGINSDLHKIAQEGARNHGLLNMSVIEFFKDINMPRPCHDEQKRIGAFLKGLSEKIELSNKELIQAQTFKKGLLQGMFV